MPKSLISIPNMGRRKPNHFQRITIVDISTLISERDMTKFLLYIRATSHMRLMPGTITLQPLSSVEMVEPVQVRFTLRYEGPMEYVNARWM
jgi:hypothetical protein